MIQGRTSHEVRGLKCEGPIFGIGKVWSHLTRGAWIEMNREHLQQKIIQVAPHTRCVD